MLARLEAAGLVTVTHIGKQKHYQANALSPVFAELRALVLKTSGLADVLRAALEPLVPRIRAAFVYGSPREGTRHRDQRHRPHDCRRGTDLRRPLRGRGECLHAARAEGVPHHLHFEGG